MSKASVLLLGKLGGGMDEPPFSLAFIMVKDGFVIAAILCYLSSDANKDRRGGHLVRMFDCVQGIEPCECKGKGH